MEQRSQVLSYSGKFNIFQCYKPPFGTGLWYTAETELLESLWAYLLSPSLCLLGAHIIWASVQCCFVLVGRSGFNLFNTVPVSPLYFKRTYILFYFISVDRFIPLQVLCGGFFIRHKLEEILVDSVMTHLIAKGLIQTSVCLSDTPDLWKLYQIVQEKLLWWNNFSQINS